MYNYMPDTQVVHYDGHIRYTTVHLTEECNLSCTYCFGKHYMSSRQMSTKTALDFAQWYTKQSKSGSYAVAFFGGEPFLRFSLMKLIIDNIKKLRKLGTDFSFSATSNGTLINETHLDFLKKNRVSVMLSTDGDEKTHNRFRIDKKGDGSFASFLKGYEFLQQIQPKVTARLTFTPETVQDLTRNHEALLLKHKFSSVAATPVTEADWTASSLEKLTDELFELAAFLLDEWNAGRYVRMRILEKGIQDILEPRVDGKIRYPCGAGRTAAGIGVDGRIYPCHRFVGMEQFVVGDIYSGVDTEKRRPFWKDPFTENRDCDGLCRSCDISEYCHSECYQVCHETTGNIHMPPATFCRIKRCINTVSLKLLKYLVENDRALLAAMTGTDEKLTEQMLPDEC
jgi:uncharacterized protein